MTGRFNTGAVREAAAAIQAAHQRAAAEISKRRDIERRAIAIADELAKLETLEAEDEALRIVDGPDAAPEKPKRTSRIENLRRARPQMSAAITLQERRIAEARAAVAPLMPALSSATLRLVADVQGDAVAKIRALLGELAAPAAQLYAADQILAAVLGTGEFAVRHGAPVPVNGARLLNGLVNNLPGPIRPDNLTSAALFEAAHQISSPLLADINGAENHE